MGDFMTAVHRAFRHAGTSALETEKEHEDAKIQLIQVAEDTEAHHRRLVDQASVVMANEKQSKMHLAQLLNEHEHIDGLLNAALTQQDAALKAGDATTAASKEAAATGFASKLTSLEAQIETTKQMASQAEQASAQAKAAVQQSSMHVQEIMDRKSRDMAQLDQAKMTEGLNAAMGELNGTLHDDSIPTMDEVEQKIQARYAKASSVTELGGTSVEMQMLDVEQAAQNVESSSLLEARRAQLGLSAPSATPALTTGS